ncbi:MFS transporter [Aquihabitans sp. G128]|uniref:MFS transporter n=1 Tax=Aquihabitans sp. G128 TaxID=2849779 RepID=UPI001C21A25A|nr:MFS transporter [Aquihabitans sp. G128]QXC60828.1 MFS transporter [Aquihabitans sp. G128]
MGAPNGRTRRERRPLPPGFGTIWTTVAVDLIGFGIVLPILPRYAEDLHATPFVIGLVVSAFSVAQMVGAPIIGRLSDRIGRKPVLILSLVGTAVGSLVTGIAGSVWILLLGRVLDGLSGASVSVAQAAVADVADPEDRPRLLGLLGAAFGVGFVVGPAIGALAAFGGPHIPFLVAAAIAAVNAVVALRRLPETHPDRTGKAAPDAHVAPDGPLPSDHPIRTWGHVPGAARRLILVAFVALFAFSGFETTFSLLVEDRFGLTIGSTGAVFAVIGLALVFVQAGLVHPVHVALGEKGTLRAALALVAVGLVVLAIDGSWFSLVPALLLLVLGQGLVTPTMTSAVAGEAPAADRGRVLGFQQSAGALARAVGPAAAGFLYGRVSIPAPYLLGAALAAAAVVLVPRSVPVASGTAPS